MSLRWQQGAHRFVLSLGVEGGASRSVPGGPATLYGTGYGLLARHYLGEDVSLSEATREFIQNGQEADTGWFAGPELRGFQPPPGARHDREHLLMHLTCAILPVCRQFAVPLRQPLTAAARFCDLDFLRAWLDARDFRCAWLEGNNLLFVGQLLVHLRDAGGDPRAAAALAVWFDWLERHLDPRTSLWGTDGACGPAEAVYGGYHQLLIYHYERRPVRNPHGLIDVVLALQHADGGFLPQGNAGACEDVDAVDILVNLYKQTDHRRREVRMALRKCADHVWAQQNPDGGFPYTRNRPQHHMGVPGTVAPPNVSAMFPTWFRIHTLALMAEVLTDDPRLAAVPFRFSETPSMGWHRAWDKAAHALSAAETRAERSELRRWKFGHAAQRTKDALWDFAQRLRARRA